MIIIKKHNTKIIEKDDKRIIKYFHKKNEFEAFDNIKAFDEICINAQEDLIYFEKTEQNILLIPLVGRFIINDKIIQANEISCLTIKANKSLTIKNNDETFGYALLLQLNKISENETINKINISDNRLNTIFQISNELTIYSGIYSLRSTDTFKSKKNSSVIVFVVAGAFEFENRLIEAKEMLLINDENKLEFEALSDQALILIIELTKQI